MRFDRIVVGVDGSENARPAVVFAWSLAREVGAEVVAVHSVGLLERFETGPEIDVIRDRLERDWCAPAHGSDVPARFVVRDGDPVSVLLGAADEVEADLIVVGSRGLGGHPELLLGSTSTQVAQRSTRPVVVVPSGARLT